MLDSIHIIDGLFAYAISSKLSLALWASPNHNLPQAIIGKANLYNPKAGLPSGFIFSPFHNQHLEKCFYIPSQGYLDMDNIPFDLDINKHWQDELRHISTPLSQTFTYKQDFITSVNKAKTAIYRGDFLKVVLARTKTKPYPAGFSLSIFLNKIVQKYPSAFKALVYTPEYGLWVCASPELLCGTSQQGRFFHTMALAGTQAAPSFNSNTDIAADLSLVSWQQKEIEEQALVSRYIIDCFKQIRLREFEESGPKTVLAGNLCHLQTNFWVDMLATNRPTLAAQMLDLLHPTSAVCGMPHDASLDFIQKSEPNGRSLYGGFLGPCNIQNQMEESQIFVMLRAANLQADHIKAYAGAGITASSIPENEWQETELKTQTLLSLL